MPKKIIITNDSTIKIWEPVGLGYYATIEKPDYIGHLYIVETTPIRKSFDEVINDLRDRDYISKESK